jgi:hypothetical protein
MQQYLETKTGEQLPSPLSTKRSSFEDRKRKTQSLCLDYQPKESPQKRARLLNDHTSLQNGNTGNQHKVTSLPKPGKERVTRKRQAESDLEGNRKRRQRQLSEEVPGSVASWLERLPASSQEFEDMSRTPSKRARSRSESNERSSSDAETESTLSRNRKYSIYQDPRYQTILESKGSFMRDSKQGPLPEEKAFCKKLLTTTTSIPKDPLFEGQLLSRFLAHFQNRSELRVCIHLHTRLIPSAELLSLLEPQKFDGLIEGNNDRWNKAIMFYRQLPQPDFAVAYRDSVFTDQQRGKLDILPEVSSFFAAREGTCFPFFTCEVKCGKQSLEIADRANTNSMTIALRGMVELYRRAGHVMDIHRRILGFSISHDDKSVRIYGHYPEIDGEKTS